MNRDFVWRTLRAVYQGKMRASYERRLSVRPLRPWRTIDTSRGWRHVFAKKLQAMSNRGK